MTNEFYTRALQVSNEVYKIDNIINTYNQISNKTYKNIINHILELTKHIDNLEILLNIDYHSIIWEYLNHTCCGLTNGIYQEFKYHMFGDITSQSKLNNLIGFNDRIAILIVRLKNIV